MIRYTSRKLATLVPKSVTPPSTKSTTRTVGGAAKTPQMTSKKTKKKVKLKQPKGDQPLLTPEEKAGCDAILENFDGKLDAALPLEDSASLVKQFKTMKSDRRAQDHGCMVIIFQTVLQAVREKKQKLLIEAGRETLGKRENKRSTAFGLLFEVVGHTSDAASKRAAICRYALARRTPPDKLSKLITDSGGIEKTCQMARRVMKALDGEIMVALVTKPTTNTDKKVELSEALIAIQHSKLAARVLKAFSSAPKDSDEVFRLGKGLVPILRKRLGKDAVSKKST